MTYLSRINARDALGYSRWGIGFGTILEPSITGGAG